MKPIHVVTLADREPWISMAETLGEAVRSLGHRFHCELTAHGERPWQAKRFALRRAFEEDFNEVYWIDPDHEITSLELFSRFLTNQEPGIHCGRLFNDPVRSVRRWGKRPNQAGSDRNMEIYQSCLAENGLNASTHFGGSIVAYSIPPESGLKLCSIWDSVAQKLKNSSTTWTDEISIGIAADTLKIPIIPDLNRQNSGLRHLNLGRSKRYFLSSPLQAQR